MNFYIQRMAKYPFPAAAIRIGAILTVLALGACGGGENMQTTWIPSSNGGGGGGVGSGVGNGVGSGAGSGEIACKDYDGNPMMVKAKTITIYNNSEKIIYPVIATSKNAVNEWIQGCFRTNDKPYPTDYVYKLYVNEGLGIAQNSSVEITLPLYSALPEADRYVTWWNGGRVLLADRNDRLRDEKDVAISAPTGVSCQGENTECQLSTYSSDVQFPEDVYAQLSEYTFADSIIPAGQTVRLLKPENVGYNISYVDHVYMPVAIGPKANSYIGYSGSTQALAPFRSNLTAFLGNSSGKGWPVYNLNELKLPGGYNVFAQRSGTLPPADNVPVKPLPPGFPPVLTVMDCITGQCSDDQKKNLHFGVAVQRMQNLWGSCVDWGAENIDSYAPPSERFACPADLKVKLEIVKQFFEKNYQDYLSSYSPQKCNGDIPEIPVFNYWQAITHIYGWVPFNEGCGAGDNPLAGTSIPGWDHAKLQSMYIHDLQYNYRSITDPRLTFNPYVKLIHDDLKMNAYSFSVDDAVGFMSELGDGLIFTVGGPKGLENEKQFDYANGFSVAIGLPQSMSNQPNTPLIKKYGVCLLGQNPSDFNCEKNKQDVTMPTNSQIAGFRVGTVASYPIKVRFTDLNDNVYLFNVISQFGACVAGAQCPPNRAEIVGSLACSVTTRRGEKHPKSDDWCANANPNQQQEGQLTKNYLSFPQPVDFM